MGKRVQIKEHTFEGDIWAGWWGTVIDDGDFGGLAEFGSVIIKPAGKGADIEIEISKEDLVKRRFRNESYSAIKI